MRSFAPLACLLALLVLPSVAQAKDDKERKVSVTVSPLHLVVPMVELTGEFRLDDKVGLAAIGGVGSSAGVALWELGGQARYYFLGDFADGLLVGAEVLYAKASLGGASANGLSPGVMAGGKTTFDFGLVLEAQAGGAWFQSGGGGSLGLLLNANLGWAF